MAEELDPEQKLSVIKDSLQEVLGESIIKDVLFTEKRPLRIYWGTAPTGKPHCGYFVPMRHIANFLRAGCHVKILLADIHGFLDNMKAPIELVQFRASYYEKTVKAILRAIGVPIERLEFQLGSKHQKREQYVMDIYRLASIVTEHDAKRAGAEVVKQSDNAPLSGLMRLTCPTYPLLQALDEEHLDVDAQFGGVDQRKIFILAAEQLPKIGYRERAHLMNRMVPGLAGGKMSSSDPDSKIDILDTPEAVKKKIKKAYALPKDLEGNGLVSFVEAVLLPVSALQKGKAEFVVERREDEGPALIYEDIETLKKDYLSDKLTPQLLKAAVTSALNNLLAPIQAEFNSDQEWQDISLKAYPPPPEAPKKQKKVKNMGTRFPGASTGASTAPDSAEALSKGQTEGTGIGDAKITSAAVGESAADAIKKLDI